MKSKIFRSMLTLWLLVSFLWTSVGTYEVTPKAEAAVLNWGTFTKSARDNTKLDCSWDKTITDNVKTESVRTALFETASPTDAQISLIADVKWCLMESKVDKYATWFIFLWIAVLVWYLIFLGIKIAIGSEGEGGWGGGGMPGGGMPGQWGGGGGVWEKVKPAIIGIWVLTFVLVWGLNALLILMKFIVDLFIK